MTRTTVEGRFHSVRKEDSSIPDIDQLTDCHMVLVLDWVQKKRDFVEVMKATTESHQDSEYLPISPAEKKPYPIQLRLANGPEFIHRGMRMINPTSLPHLSYLKIDSRYEVPIHTLKKEVDTSGDQYKLPAKGEGRIRQLRDHTNRRDHVRHLEQLRHTQIQLQEHQHDEEELCRLAGKQSLEDSGKELGEGNFEVLVQA